MQKCKRCEMHTMYQETRDNWHALDLLTMIEESHSKTALLGTEYARTEAYERFLNIKQDWNASLVTYKADFEECIIQLKKYGDIPFTKKDIVLRFVRSLNGRHNAYAIKVTEDYHSSRPIPRDIDDVVTQLTIFEAARADVYGRSKAARDSYHEQMAIHRVQNEEKQDKRVSRVKSTDECKNCGEKGHWAFQCKAPKKAKDQNGESVKKVRCVRVCRNDDLYYKDPVEAEVVRVVNWTNNRKNPLGVTPPTWVCLDNGAECSIFVNKDLLTDLHKGKRISLRTVAGNKVLDTWGYFGPFKVLYDPNGDANLLSEDEVLTESENVISRPGEHFTAQLKHTGESMKFLKLQKNEFGEPNKF